MVVEREFTADEIDGDDWTAWVGMAAEGRVLWVDGGKHAGMYCILRAFIEKDERTGTGRITFVAEDTPIRDL